MSRWRESGQKMKHRNYWSRGFTLIETLIVVAVGGILASISLLKFSESTTQARIARCTYNASIGQKAYTVYLAQGGAHNPVGETGAAFLVSAGYLAADLTGGTYTWTAGAGGQAILNCSVDGTTVAAAATIFDSSSTGWNIVNKMGNWDVVGSSLVARVSTTSSAQNRALIAGTNGTDYEITANAQLSSGAGYGIYYRTSETPTASDPNSISGYVLQFDHGLGDKFVIRKVTNGVESATVASASMPSGFAVNGAHQVTVSVSGNTTIVKVDGTQVLSYTDASSTFSSGSVGVRSWSNSTASIQDLKVVTH